MINKQYPTTSKTIDFIKSFSDIKMMTTVFGIIDMHEQKQTSSVFILKEEKDKNRVSLKEYTNTKNSFKLDWKDGLSNIVTIYLNRMTEELTRWIAVGDKLEVKTIIELIEKNYTDLQKKLSKSEITSKSIAFNKQLEKSTIRGKEDLAITTDIDEYMLLIEIILRDFENQIQILKQEQINRRVELIFDNDKKPKELEFVVDHQLRWNTRVDNFEEIFGTLVEQEAFKLATGKGGKEEIMRILKMVFEEVEPPASKYDIRMSSGKIPMTKKPFVIPDQLVWELGTNAFKEEISPLIKNPKTIFIEKFTDTARAGEIKSIAKILRQVIVFPYADKSGLWTEKVLMNYINDPVSKRLNTIKSSN